MSHANHPQPDGTWNSYLVVMWVGLCVGTFGGALAALAVHHFSGR